MDKLAPRILYAGDKEGIKDPVTENGIPGGRWSGCV